MLGDDNGSYGVTADTPDWVLENPTGGYSFEGDDLPLEGEKFPAGGLSSSPSAHVDLVEGPGAAAGAFDYGSLFATIAKTTGDVVSAGIGQGLPGPVAAAAAAAAAARQEAVRQQEAAKQVTQPAVVKVNAAAAPMSTGALVALGLGGLGITTLLALAATRKGRR